MEQTIGKFRCKMKVLLINPPAFKIPRWDVPRPFYPPLGVCYLAAVLEKNNYDAKILDADILNYGFDEILDEIKKEKPTLIGVGSVTVKYGVSIELINLIKKEFPKIKIVAGGNHVTLVKEKAFKDINLDYAIYGEAEFTLLELVQALEGNKLLKDVNGLIYKDKNRIIVNPMRVPVKDLDVIPFPARHLLKGFPRLYKNDPRYKQLPMTHMVTSRGCYYRCIFCDHDRNVRYFSPKYVVDEIEHLQQKYGINEIHFWDEIFMMTPKRAKDICEEIARRKISITWSGYGRLSIIAKNPEVAGLMKKAGCWELNVGIESGNQKVLDFIKKDMTLEEIKKGCEVLRKEGIFIRGLFMLGHLIDTKETIEDTVKLALELPLNSVQFNFNIPLPETEQYGLADKYGSFADSDYEHMSGHSEEPVFIPKGLTKDYLTGIQKKAYKAFYRRPRLVLRNLKYINNIDSFKKYLTKFARMIKG